MGREYKAHKLKRQIDELYDQLHAHQERCQHAKAVGHYGADTGNWCSQDDDYWIDCICPVCLKRWTVYSSKDPEGYRYFSLNHPMIRSDEEWRELQKNTPQEETVENIRKREIIRKREQEDDGFMLDKRKES